MDKKLLGALVAVGILTGVLVAIALVNRDSDDRARPSPPCPTPWTESPEAKCLRSTEACSAYYTLRASESVRCTAESDDGRGVLRYQLNGAGRVEVKVLDHVSQTIATRSVQLSGPLTDDDAVNGPKGTWTLDVRFETTSGSGTVWLYG